VEIRVKSADTVVVRPNLSIAISEGDRSPARAPGRNPIEDPERRRSVVNDPPERPLAVRRSGSGLQFLQLALDQVFGVLRITLGKWSQCDGSTTLWDDHEVKPHHQEALRTEI